VIGLQANLAERGVDVAFINEQVAGLRLAIGDDFDRIANSLLIFGLAGLVAGAASPSRQRLLLFAALAFFLLLALRIALLGGSSGGFCCNLLYKSWKGAANRWHHRGIRADSGGKQSTQRGGKNL